MKVRNLYPTLFVIFFVGGILYHYWLLFTIQSDWENNTTFHTVITSSWQYYALHFTPAFFIIAFILFEASLDEKETEIHGGEK